MALLPPPAGRARFGAAGLSAGAQWLHDEKKSTFYTIMTQTYQHRLCEIERALNRERRVSARPTRRATTAPHARAGDVRLAVKTTCSPSRDAQWHQRCPVDSI